MNFQKLTAFLESLKEDYGVPSCECRIIKNNQVIFNCKAGDYDENKKFYYIYSMTKIITAVAAMRLVEQGKLSLGDNVEKYLPQFSELTVNNGEKIWKAKNKLTVENLLSMQGGFDYNIESEHIKAEILKNPEASTEEMVNAIGKSYLMFEPGDNFSYSLCYDVLGAVIEKASGMKLGEFMKKEIFEPLGMNDTAFDINEVDVEKIVPHYTYNASKNCAEELPKSNVYVFSPKYESGGAGLVSTFDDYCKFTETVASGGTSKNGYVLLTKGSIEEITKKRMNDKILSTYFRYPAWGCHYGFSVRVLFDKSKCETPAPVGCFELTGAAGSYAVFDVENNITIVYFQHIKNIEAVPEFIHHKIRDLAYEELL